MESDYKRRDAQSYDHVAGTFDDLAERYTVRVARAVARAIDPSNRTSVIDMGCGTGVVSREIARQSGTGTTIVGVDLSQGMLEIARDRARSAGVAEKVTFLAGDAEALDLPDGRFDGYVSLYAFSHFPNPQKAVAEAFRILAPGGRVAVAIGSGPSLFSMAGMGRAIALVRRVIAERAGRELHASAHLDGLVRQHLRTTEETMIAAWSADRRDPIPRLMDLMRGAGFADVRSDWYGAEYTIGDIEEFWDLQTTLSTWSRKFMQRATTDELARLKQAFWDDCRKVQARGGRMMYRVGAGLVLARKGALATRMPEA